MFLVYSSVEPLCPSLFTFSCPNFCKNKKKLSFQIVPDSSQREIQAQMGIYFLKIFIFNIY